MRKYLIDSKPRNPHLLGQVWTETGYLRTTREGGADNAEYAPYIGRGLIQITWQDKYDAYREYAQLGPDFDIELIATDPYHAGNSSGFYWVSRTYKEPLHRSTSNLSRLADSGISTDAIGRLCLWINGGTNHFDHRHIHSLFVDRVINDVVYSIHPLVQDISFNRVAFVRETVAVNGRQVRRIVGTEVSDVRVSIRVDHTPQR